MIKVRFAPSPSGYVHIGNIKTAIFNWLFLLSEKQKGNDGKFLLRIDDTDLSRTKQEYIDAVKEDVKWFGIDWDESFHQSSRFDRYNECFEKLKAEGRVYVCYETAEELEAKRKRQIARKVAPVYDRSALNLTEEDKKKLEAEGRKPYWRFKLNEGDVVFNDLVKGECKFNMKHLSDPVIIREDGTYLYNFPSVIDDMDSGITHIIRGQDHLTNTAMQIQMFEALGAKFIPQFAHYPMILNAEGHKFSKRESDISIRNLKNDGIEAMTIANILVGLGSANGGKMHKNMEELASTFALSNYGSAFSRFDMDTFYKENGKLLRVLDFDDVKDRLVSIDGRIDAKFWNMVRGNIDKLSDISYWVNVVYGDIEAPALSSDERSFLNTALSSLPVGDFDENTMKIWANAIMDATGKKGRDLYHPIRLCLTGIEYGPEMTALLPLMGRDKVIERIKKSV
ncbi:glutamate--tRNA ligase [bacterium]|nr:glutamate--tRNA ligase [bacterium]